MKEKGIKMKEIKIHFDTLENVSLIYNEEVTASNLINASSLLLNKAKELTFYNESYTAIEKVFDSEELDNSALMKSIVVLAEKTRKIRKNIEGPDFIAKLVMLLFKKDFFNDATVAVDFINSLSGEDFLFLTEDVSSTNN